MAAPRQVAEPHKELRFTRAGQAQVFWILAAILTAFSVFLVANTLSGHPDFRWWWVPLPLLPAAALIWLAFYCTRHAYLILTPLGLEIFPLRKPRQNLHLIYWSELTSAEFNEDLTLLKLHYDSEKTSGVIASLKPLLPRQRDLLRKGIEGRLKARN